MLYRSIGLLNHCNTQTPIIMISINIEAKVTAEILSCLYRHITQDALVTTKQTKHKQIINNFSLSFDYWNVYHNDAGMHPQLLKHDSYIDFQWWGGGVWKLNDAMHRQS